MPRKSYTIEQIISKLREAEVLLSQGQNVGENLLVPQYQRTNLLSLVERKWGKSLGSGTLIKGRAGEIMRRRYGCLLEDN